MSRLHPVAWGRMSTEGQHTTFGPQGHCCSHRAGRMPGLRGVNKLVTRSRFATSECWTWNRDPPSALYFVSLATWPGHLLPGAM